MVGLFEPSVHGPVPEGAQPPSVLPDVAADAEEPRPIFDPEPLWRCPVTEEWKLSPEHVAELTALVPDGSYTAEEYRARLMHMQMVAKQASNEFLGLIARGQGEKLPSDDCIDAYSNDPWLRGIRTDKLYHGYVYRRRVRSLLFKAADQIKGLEDIINLYKEDRMEMKEQLAEANKKLGLLAAGEPLPKSPPKPPPPSSAGSNARPLIGKAAHPSSYKELKERPQKSQPKEVAAAAEVVTAMTKRFQETDAKLAQHTNSLEAGRQGTLTLTSAMARSPAAATAAEAIENPAVAPSAADRAAAAASGPQTRSRRQVAAASSPQVNQRAPAEVQPRAAASAGAARPTLSSKFARCIVQQASQVPPAPSPDAAADDAGVQRQQQRASSGLPPLPPPSKAVSARKGSLRKASQMAVDTPDLQQAPPPAASPSSDKVYSEADMRLLAKALSFVKEGEDAGAADPGVQEQEDARPPPQGLAVIKEEGSGEGVQGADGQVLTPRKRPPGRPFPVVMPMPQHVPGAKTHKAKDELVHVIPLSLKHQNWQPGYEKALFEKSMEALWEIARGKVKVTKDMTFDKKSIIPIVATVNSDTISPEGARRVTCFPKWGFSVDERTSGFLQLPVVPEFKSDNRSEGPGGGAQKRLIVSDRSLQAFVSAVEADWNLAGIVPDLVSTSDIKETTVSVHIYDLISIKGTPAFTCREKEVPLIVSYARKYGIEVKTG